MTADFKSPARIVDRNAGKDKVAGEGCCRVTGLTRNVTRFHAVGRDLGGDDLPDNIIPIDHELHMRWEHDPNGKQTYGPLIWEAMRPWEQDYVLEKKGVEYVRRYFGVDLLDSKEGAAVTAPEHEQPTSPSKEMAQSVQGEHTRPRSSQPSSQSSVSPPSQAPGRPVEPTSTPDAGTSCT